MKYSINGDNIADDNDVDVLRTGNIGRVYSYNANRQLLTLAVEADGTQTNTYAVADDVVIIGVNTDDEEANEGYTTVSALRASDRSYRENIVYVLNSDDEVVAIFTDADGIATDSSIRNNRGAAIEAD